MPPLAILVLSCDKYDDLWEPFFDNFRKMWPGCRHQIYLLTNAKSFEDDYVISLKVGEDISWGDNLIRGLNKIPEEYVLTIFDDLFFKNEVNNEKVDSIFKVFIDNKMDYLKLNNTRAMNLKSVKNGIGVIPPGAAYRSSAVVTIWKKEILKVICDRGDSAWSFEIYGSERTDPFKYWYGCSCEFLPVYNLVIKGKYERYAYAIIEKNGIKLSTKREKMSIFENIKYYLSVCRSNLYYTCVPFRLQRFIRKLFGAYT